MKYIMTICMVLGMLIAGLGIYTKIKAGSAIAVIGGADGPTSIFVAGKVSEGGQNVLIGGGIVLVIASAALYLLKRKKKQ